MAAPVVSALLSWVAMSLGFLGLTVLMRERPQFVGQPLRVSKAELVQESPQVVVRKVTDDIAVTRPMQPEFSDIQFDMAGRRDYRGLRTVMDMSGDFRARYELTNACDEAVFVLFKCPHPHAESGAGHSLLAGGLKLQASTAGVQENGKDAWYWSGTVDPHGMLTLSVSYQVASLKGVAYRVGGSAGNPVKRLRVTLHRRDLESMRFEGGDGTIPAGGDAVVWERNDFLAPDFFAAEVLESRNLFASLSQLLEIGPVVSLLFLLAVSAVILARQPMTVIQMLTLSAGYAFYFPLILYLSARFSFVVALVIAVVVPGVLLVNYGRWLLGARLGWIGGAVFLVLYQVFPTLAAFAGWNRGMVLLCLGVVTLWVLIHLQNEALRRRASRVLALGLIVGMSWVGAAAAEIQVVLPGELASGLLGPKPEPAEGCMAFDPAEYEVQQEGTYFRVNLRMPFHVVRAGDRPTLLFSMPVHVQESGVGGAESGLARLVTMTNRLGLMATGAGSGQLCMAYRVPVEVREGKHRAQVPLVLGASGRIRLESSRSSWEFLNGSLWASATANQKTAYEVGVAGESSLILECRDLEGGAGAGSKEFYGIGLTRAQHLTVIASDGSCAHFAEFEIPMLQGDEFRLQLAAGERLISASVNGVEVSSPPMDGQLCRLRLPGREAQQTVNRLSFRMALPPVRLGFVGWVELALPEVFQTAGTLEWVVALPNGFDTQVISSGLEIQKAVPDLNRFGDYGRILKSHPHAYLAKDLAPPGRMSVSLKYRQRIPGLYEVVSE